MPAQQAFSNNDNFGILDLDFEKLKQHDVQLVCDYFRKPADYNILNITLNAEIDPRLMAALNTYINQPPEKEVFVNITNAAGLIEFEKLNLNSNIAHFEIQNESKKAQVLAKLQTILAEKNLVSVMLSKHFLSGLTSDQLIAIFSAVNNNHHIKIFTFDYNSESLAEDSTEKVSELADILRNLITRKDLFIHTNLEQFLAILSGQEVAVITDTLVKNQIPFVNTNPKIVNTDLNDFYVDNNWHSYIASKVKTPEHPDSFSNPIFSIPAVRQEITLHKLIQMIGQIPDVSARLKKAITAQVNEASRLMLPSVWNQTYEQIRAEIDKDPEQILNSPTLVSVQK